MVDIGAATLLSVITSQITHVRERLERIPDPIETGSKNVSVWKIRLFAFGKVAPSRGQQMSLEIRLTLG